MAAKASAGAVPKLRIEKLHASVLFHVSKSFNSCSVGLKLSF